LGPAKVTEPIDAAPTPAAKEVMLVPEKTLNTTHALNMAHVSDEKNFFIIR
jgi:hypothetical protein